MPRLNCERNRELAVGDQTNEFNVNFVVDQAGQVLVGATVTSESSDPDLSNNSVASDFDVIP